MSRNGSDLQRIKLHAIIAMRRARFALAPQILAAAIAVTGLNMGTGVSRAGDQKSGFVTYQLTNYGKRDHDVVATFGAVFARGDVPRGTRVEVIDNDGRTIPSQLDAKATHGDGSLRHGVLTVSVPQMGTGATIPITLRRVSAGAVAQPPISTADLPPDFDAVVSLQLQTTKVSVSARDLLGEGKKDTWLSGPYVGEWWVAGPVKDARGDADPHLRVQFGIRSYGKGQPVRVEVDVENDWTWVADPKTEFYDADIRVGARTVFQKAKMIQPSHTRWRMGFWWNEPVSVYVKQDLAYLKKTRVIPNYQPGLQVSDTAISLMYKHFLASNRDPMCAGMLTAYMPTTGGRWDIAPLPQWQAVYLLTMDPRAYEMTLQSADLGGSFPFHYRSEKTLRPITLEEYPNISTHSNYVGRPGQLQQPDTGGYKSTLVADTAHQPALDFIPYLITGDRYYLEELQFLSQWNSTGTAPEYHGFGQGLISWDQVRAQAWSLRTLAQAEFITPDADPLKHVLQSELKANISWYESHFSANPRSNQLGLLYKTEVPGGYDEGRDIAPWQDDFFTWALGYVQALGDVDSLALLRWKTRFPVGRMIGKGFCWILAPSYAMRVREGSVGDFYTGFDEVYRATLAQQLKGKEDPNTIECASSEMAAALGLHQAGEMVNNAAGSDGYSAYLQPALAAAVDSGAPGANAAWDLFSARKVKPDFSAEPGWDIVPWPKP